MTYLRTGSKKVQEEPGTSWAKKQGSAQRMMGTCEKDTEWYNYFGRQFSNSFHSFHIQKK